MAVKTKKRPPRQKKAKQTFLPGMEPPRIQAIDEAAEQYHTVKLERVQLSQEEAEAQDKLTSAMKEAKVTSYETPDGLIVTISTTEKAKTKRKKSEGKPEDNGDGD